MTTKTTAIAVAPPPEDEGGGRGPMSVDVAVESSSLSQQQQQHAQQQVADINSPLASFASDPKNIGRADVSTSAAAMSGASEALADEMTSSLANIATSGGTAAGRATARRDRNSSEERGAEFSSSSSGNQKDGEASGPATVTNNTATTSSGDDRDSSTGGAGSGSAAATNTSGDDQGSGSHTVKRVAIGESTLASRHHYQHSHPSKPRKRGQPKQAPGPAKFSRQQQPADQFGLPVPQDDRRLVQAQNASSSKHATVVAHHLPPPATDTTPSSSSGSGAEAELISRGDTNNETASLLQPHREPGFHTIRRTFNKIVHRNNTKRSASAETNSSSSSSTGQHNTPRAVHKKPGKRAAVVGPQAGKKRPAARAGRKTDGSSSGSGTEGGYAGSASSSENNSHQAGCSSGSSTEESMTKARKRTAASASNDPTRPLLSRKQESSLSMSSEIADFSSEASSETSITSSSNMDGSSDEQEEPSDEDKGVGSGGDDSEPNISTEPPRKRPKRRWSLLPMQVPQRKSPPMAIPSPPRPERVVIDDSKPAARVLLQGKPPMLSLGCDVMAHVLTFLEPPDILDVLTMPLSKDWVETFTRQPELWRVLCHLEPFKAPVEDESDGESSDDSLDSFPLANPVSDANTAYGKFRLLYTSFVRCMRYLATIKDDAVQGRPPSMIDYATASRAGPTIGAGTRALARLGSIDSSDDDAAAARAMPAGPIGVADDGSASTTSRKRRNNIEAAKTPTKKGKVKYGRSMLTDRLLGPTADGEAGDLQLPWSCAIYSIVNWMTAFSDVEGIQTMCLKVLPFLLEDEQQRMTAQRAGLTEIVLRDMVMFPNSSQLHTAAFHTIVLLARPLGGREGMLFHTSMVNSSGIFSSAGGSHSGKSGIAVMLDSMRRFRHDEVLQAMSCWSLVNIALAPAQKEVLVKLGGIGVTAGAMLEHPHSAEVQFRALFALINLVIPSVRPNDDDQQAAGSSDDEESTEREMLDEIVEQITNLVVLAMKNFCSSEAILNRACLVLHNLSLTQEYHESLLWTPNCYQMLEWCLANYTTDQVLQQSAAGTLHRLQMTLSGDESLRTRFAASLRKQQQLSLEQAHQEAVMLHQLQENQAPRSPEPEGSV